MTTSEPPGHVMVGPVGDEPSTAHQRHLVPYGPKITQWAGSTAYYAVCGALCVPGPAWYVDGRPRCAECARIVPEFAAPAE